MHLHQVRTRDGSREKAAVLEGREPVLEPTHHERRRPDLPEPRADVKPVAGEVARHARLFLAAELVPDYGAWHLILLGSVAVLLTLVCPQGLWGLMAQRRGLSLFPLQRRASA
jgi:hypothetical protein